MREAVVVSSSRTPLAKSFRGSFNMTRPDDLAAHCIKDALGKVPQLEVMACGNTLRLMRNFGAMANVPAVQPRFWRISKTQPNISILLALFWIMGRRRLRQAIRCMLSFQLRASMVILGLKVSSIGCQKRTRQSLN